MSTSNVLNLMNPLRQRNQNSDRGLSALRQASLRLSDLSNGRGRLRAKEVLGYLMCHGARLSRASAPRAQIRLTVTSPTHLSAVKIRL